MTALATDVLRLLGVSPLAGIPGGPELWIILVIILILFGRRLPGVARSLGQGISSFKKGLSEPLENDEDDKPESPPKVEASTSEKATSASED